jgi:ketosteroid isomerase-like protein
MSTSTEASVERLVRELFEAVDALDFETIGRHIADDAQGVDELSRGWLRGRAALEAYFRQLEGSIESVESQLSDIHATEWGDAGLVTCKVDQTYRMGGQEQRIQAPTSVVCRRENGDWRVVLLHSVPLPEAAGN